MKILRSFLTALSLASAFVAVAKAPYVTVGIQSKVFDEPNANGYVTLNQHNGEVVITPGMVFKNLEDQNGWYLVEYSPGLRGYVSGEVVSKPARAPKGGTYKLVNRPSQSVTVADNGGKWTLTAAGKTYAGQLDDNVLVFPDPENGYPAFSVVDLGAGPIAVTYDNTVTSFF